MWRTGMQGIWQVHHVHRDCACRNYQHAKLAAFLHVDVQHCTKNESHAWFNSQMQLLLDSCTCIDCKLRSGNESTARHCKGAGLPYFTAIVVVPRCALDRIMIADDAYIVRQAGSQVPDAVLVGERLLHLSGQGPIIAACVCIQSWST